jgi:hypothetical protein
VGSKIASVHFSYTLLSDVVGLYVGIGILKQLLKLYFALVLSVATRLHSFLTCRDVIGPSVIEGGEVFLLQWICIGNNGSPRVKLEAGGGIRTRAFLSCISHTVASKCLLTVEIESKKAHL